MGFVKGQIVNFVRNTEVFTNNTPVAAVIEREDSSTYIVENIDYGWTPQAIQVTRYDIDISKKYLFVSEDELTAV